ncbi:GHKL domain-containing protein [Borrelia anserina]|uniref:histidine kinase n=3 Tax=Borrelia anserina TaxID=143 RepID=W5SP92_BORAN|nr:ATP-binding protein [Borrelia anserina]AHH08730.1 Sensory transduction protein kinase [Borrelia anserina BA2]APR65183.1 histidine kinase [Borrelia anserina Es]UPA07108.1 GHKL domain-containing protein [Borrelia anserina]
MSKFLKKTLTKLNKLSSEQKLKFIQDIYKKIEIYDGIFASINEGILVLDKLNNIIYLNKMLFQILAISPKYKLETLQDIQIPNLTNLIEELAINEDKIIGFEVQISTNIYIKISFMPYVRDQKLEGNIILIEDIKDKKHKEELFRRAEALAAFTRHARNIAHEIKNPLGAIDINLQLLKKEIDRHDIKSTKANNYFQIIKEEINRMDKTITDFLLTVRPIKIIPEKKDITEIIKSVYNLLNPELQNKDIKFLLNLNKLSLALIDEKLIRQVIINIVKNAEEALVESNKKIKKIEISTYENEEKIYFSIKDNGNGIKNETKDDIFKPQFSTKESGSGIGLTISYKIVKEHGGEIFVESKEMKGTSFTITLPKLNTDKILIEGCLENE